MEIRSGRRTAPRLALAALLLAAACGGDGLPDRIDRAEREALAHGDSTYNQRRIRHFLYDEGLIRISAIRLELADAVHRCGRGDASRESAMRELRYIIEDWRLSHRAEVDLARRLQAQSAARDDRVLASDGISSLDAGCGVVGPDGMPASPPGIATHSESPLRWIGSSDHSGRGF